MIARQVGHRLADRPLVPVEEGQREADLHARGLDAELVVVTGHGLHEDIRDRLDPFASHHDLIATDLREGRLDLGAAVEQIGQSPVEIERADLGLQRPGIQRRRPQLRRADHGDQFLPVAPVAVLRIAQGHALATLADPRLEEIRLVSLAGVHHFPRRPDQVLVQSEHLAVDPDDPLCGEDFEELDADAIEDAHLLPDGLPSRRIGLLGELGAAEAELARGHDLPLDERGRYCRPARVSP